MPKASEQNTDTGERRRTRRRDIKNKDLTSSVVQGLAEIVPEERRRRRRRGEKSPLEVEKKIEPKIISYPLPEQQAEINQLAQEIANQTAQKFLDCIPLEMKEILSEEQLEYQQSELSVGITEALRSKLGWALNQAWLEAKNSQKSQSKR